MTSPFAGQVIDKHIVLGEALDTEDVAFVIADIRSVWIDVKVYEKDLPHVRKGQRVSVAGPGGEIVAEFRIVKPGPEKPSPEMIINAVRVGCGEMVS